MQGAYTFIGIDPVLQESVPVYDPQNGLYWKQVWQGTYAAIRGKINELGLENSDTDQRFDMDGSQAPLYRLTVTTPDYELGGNNALNRWELFAAKIEKEVYELPGVSAMDQFYVRRIKKLVANKTEIVNDTKKGYFNTADQAILYNLALKGSRKFLQHEWTFRYTIVTSKRYGVLVSLAKTETLWTTEQLLTPNLSGLIIPAATLFSIAAIPKKGDANGNVNEVVPLYDGSGGSTTHTYKWSWLKLAPEFLQLPSGKIEVRQEWLLDLWSTWEYPLAYQ